MRRNTPEELRVLNVFLCEELLPHLRLSALTNPKGMGFISVESEDLEFIRYVINNQEHTELRIHVEVNNES